MRYEVLADFVVLVHFLWILFLIFGGIWGRKNVIVRLLHVPGLVFAFLLEVFDWYCPLTYLEVWLRNREFPPQGYAGSCIAHYLEKLVYIQLRPGTLMVLTILVLIFNVWIYLYKKKS